MGKYSKDYSKAFEAMNKKPALTKDTKIYKPKLVDGKAIATFRFLDAPDSDVPFVARKYHYWNKQSLLCPKTFGMECPICKFNLDHNMNNEKTYIHNLGTSYQSYYYMNMVVVSDKNVPENVGKNFIFRYGNPIKDKLEEVMNDSFIPWDEDYGINFRLEVILKDNQNNYANSRFLTNDESDNIETKYIETSLTKHFKNIDEIKANTIPIMQFINKDELLSYDELKALLDARVAECDENGMFISAKSAPKSEPKVQKSSKTITDDSKFEDDDDDDFPMPKK